MKKIFLVLAGALLMAVTPAVADGSGSQGNVHLDVWPLLWDTLSVGGEYALPFKNFSVAGNVEYSPNFAWATNISLFDITAKVRYYVGDYLNFGLPDFLSFLKKGPLDGAFVGVGGSYNSVSESWLGYTWTASNFGLILEVGSKYYFGTSRWFAEGVLGVDIESPTTWSGGGSGITFSGSAYNPSVFYFDVSVGYAF